MLVIPAPDRWKQDNPKFKVIFTLSYTARLAWDTGDYGSPPRPTLSLPLKNKYINHKEIIAKKQKQQTTKNSNVPKILHFVLGFFYSFVSFFPSVRPSIRLSIHSFVCLREALSSPGHLELSYTEKTGLEFSEILPPPPGKFCRVHHLLRKLTFVRTDSKAVSSDLALLVV